MERSAQEADFPRQAETISAFTWFERVLNAAGTLGIVLLMILINADVIGRAAFGMPITGVPEIVRLVIVGIVFLQAAHTLASGRLTRSTLGLDFMQYYFPRARAGLDALFHVIGAVLFALVAWGGWPLLIKSWSRGEFLGAEGVFAAPVWPVKALVILGCVAISIQFLISGWAAFTKGRWS